MPTTVSTPRKIVATVSANATLAKGRHTPVDATSGALTLTLPTDAAAGVEISVEKIDGSANAVTVSGSLRGSASTITLTTQFEARTFLSEGAGSWRPTSDHRTASALAATFVTPDVIAVGAGIDPTGSADSTTALQAKIDATPTGGRLYIPRGTYKISAALTITKHITIEGNSVSPTFPSNNDGTTPTGLTGTVFQQTAVGTDGVKVTGSAISVNLRNLGVQFAAGLASTGHGFNASPSAIFPTTSGHTIGMNDFRWDNLQVYGHDGNHYGFVWLNPLLGTTAHLRSFLGGGFYTECDAGAINAGNIVHTHPYNELSNLGTAGGFVHKAATLSGVPGQLGLLVYIRPQVIMGGAAKTAASANQFMYDDQGGVAASPTPAPSTVTVIAPDFEGTGSKVRLGVGTSIVGTDLITGSSRPYPNNTVAVGYGALPNPTGAQHTAVGYQALAVMGNGTQIGSTTGNTGVGFQALTAATTGNNTALGAFAASGLTSGGSVVALGFGALQNTTAGNANTAIGREAMVAGAGADGNTAVGYQAAKSLNGGTGKNTFLGGLAGVTATPANATTTGAQQVVIGYNAGQSSATQLGGLTAVGYQALGGGNNATALGASAVAAGQQGTALGASSAASVLNAIAVGYQAAASGANAIAIGQGTTASGNGSVAIGKDSSNVSATATVANSIALGTATHQVQVSNNTTGAGSAALGANCPAVTATAPFTWFKMLSSDGSTVYVPAWK